MALCVTVRWRRANSTFECTTEARLRFARILSGVTEHVMIYVHGSARVCCSSIICNQTFPPSFASGLIFTKTTMIFKCKCVLEKCMLLAAVSFCSAFAIMTTVTGCACEIQHQCRRYLGTGINHVSMYYRRLKYLLNAQWCSMDDDMDNCMAISEQQRRKLPKSGSVGKFSWLWRLWFMRMV